MSPQLSPQLLPRIYEPLSPPLLPSPALPSLPAMPTTMTLNEHLTRLPVHTIPLCEQDMPAPKEGENNGEKETETDTETDSEKEGGPTFGTENEHEFVSAMDARRAVNLKRQEAKCKELELDRLIPRPQLKSSSRLPTKTK
jgi:hypothetical protein